MLAIVPDKAHWRDTLRWPVKPCEKQNALHHSWQHQHESNRADRPVEPATAFRCCGNTHVEQTARLRLFRAFGDEMMSLFAAE